MTTTRPEFHLRRVFTDGTSDPVQVYTLDTLPSGLPLSRRSIIGTGLTMASAVGLLSGCGEKSSPTTTGSAASTVPKPPPAANVSAHTGGIRGLAVSPDGKILVSVGDDKQIKLWSLPDGQLMKKFEGNSSNPVITPDGKELLLISEVSGKTNRSKLQRWSFPEGKLLSEIETDNLAKTVISPDGRTVVTRGSSGFRRVQLWSLPELELQRTIGGDAPLPGQDDQSFVSHCVDLMDLSPDGSLVVTMGDDRQCLFDKSLRFWPLTGELKTREAIKLPEKVNIKNLVFSPDGEQVIGWDGSYAFYYYGIHAGDSVRRLGYLGNEDSISTSLFSPDRNLLLTGGSYGLICLYSLTDGSCVAQFGHPDPNPPEPQERTMVGSGQGRFPSSIEDEFKARRMRLPVVIAFALTPDSRLLISGDNKGTIITWDFPVGERRSYAFDPEASQSDGSTYDVFDNVTGRTVTYTLPCGSTVPAGATCVCNCVPGTYQPPRESGSSDTHCRCVPVCTCIPVCQAHRVLDPDPVVRRMAESLLFVMGKRELQYMDWAAGRAESPMQDRLREIRDSIVAEASRDPAQWPAPHECARYLNDPDEVTAIMAAQMLNLYRTCRKVAIDHDAAPRIAELLARAEQTPWYRRSHPSMSGLSR